MMTPNGLRQYRLRKAKLLKVEQKKRCKYDSSKVMRAIEENQRGLLAWIDGINKQMDYGLSIK